MQTHNLYLADSSEVLMKVEETLNLIQYPDSRYLRSLVRHYCIARAVEEILLVQGIERVPYLEHAYHLVKNAYAVNRHGFIVGLLQDVNTFCLHSFRSSDFAFETDISVRGKWFIARTT